MKTHPRQPLPHGSHSAVSSIVALTALLWGYHAGAASLLTVNLGTSAGFAVLAGAGITIEAPANSTSVTGDIGSHSTVSITGLENLILNGVNHAGDAVTQSAKTDLMLAYIDAASRPSGISYASGHDLTGTLTTGVYSTGGSLSLGGVLTLDGLGNPDSVWIFQMGSSLDVASPGSVVFINGADPSRVFWQVGSSATFETGSNFAGNILASQSITFKTGSSLTGRALASVGAVTLGGTTIAIPEPSALIFGLAGALVIGFKRRR